MHDVFLVDGVRTPIGRHGGQLSLVRPDDLAATVVRSVAQRTSCAEVVDEVTFATANGAGEENRNVARMAVLLAGLPLSVPASTVNRLCGSGMEAVVSASRAIALADSDVAIAGGVESMSRAPWVVEKPAKAFDSTNHQMWSTTVGWRMVNPRMLDEWTVSMGEGAEILADNYGITREQQDRFAAESHLKASRAWDAGWFSAETVPVEAVDVARDECIRPNTSLETLARLRPVFRPGGSVTPGNSSPISDGAAALVLANSNGVNKLGIEPLARIVGHAVVGVEPRLYGIGPVGAARRALEKSGIGWADISAVELNEAFAAQSLACLAEWPELDPALVNPSGGAISLGHPLGCSGARILVTLMHNLARTGGRYGLAAMCIGVGQGIAMVIENLRIDQHPVQSPRSTTSEENQ